MELSKIINSIGLILDLIGVILIFFYGLPPALEKNRNLDWGVGESENITSEEEAEDKKYKLFNKIGLWFLFGGFSMQLLSNLIK